MDLNEASSDQHHHIDALRHFALIDELVHNALQYLPMPDLLNACLVSPSWNLMIHSSHLIWMIQSRAIGWPINLSSHLDQHHLAKPPSFYFSVSPPFSSLQQQEQESQLCALPQYSYNHLSWRQFYQILNNKCHLFIYINSYLTLPSCLSLLSRVTGMDTALLKREIGGSSKGKIFVLHSESLINCLKMQRRLQQEMNHRILTSIETVGQYDNEGNENNEGRNGDNGLLKTLAQNELSVTLSNCIYEDFWCNWVVDTDDQNQVSRDELVNRKKDQFLERTRQFTTGVNCLNHRFAVAVMNDEVHSFDQVTTALRQSTGMNYERADMITWRAHSSGSCICFESSDLDQCLNVIEILRQARLDCQLRAIELDSMNKMEETYHREAQSLEEYKKKSETPSKESTATSEDESDQKLYCVLLGRDERHSAAMMMNTFRSLSMSPTEALESLFRLTTSMFFPIVEGSKTEAERAYDFLNSQLYNVTLISKEDYERNIVIRFDDEMEFTDGLEEYEDDDEVDRGDEYGGDVYDDFEEAFEFDFGNPRGNQEEDEDEDEHDDDME